MFDSWKLYLARHNANLTQKELASKAGIHEITVRRLELGDVVTPHFGTLLRLCDVLKIKPWDLMK